MSVKEVYHMSQHLHIDVRTRIVLPGKLFSSYRLDGQTFRVARLQGLLRVLLDIRDNGRQLRQLWYLETFFFGLLCQL